MDKHQELINSIIMQSSVNDIPEAEPLPDNVINQLQPVSIDQRFKTVVENMVGVIELFLPLEEDDDYDDEMITLLTSVQEFLNNLVVMSYLALPDDKAPSVDNLLLQLVNDGYDLVDKAITIEEYLSYLQSDTVREHLLLPFNHLLNQAPANKSELQAMNLGAYFAQDHFALLTPEQKANISYLTEDARTELGHLSVREYYNQLSFDDQLRLEGLSSREIESNVRNNAGMN